MVELHNLQVLLLTSNYITTWHYNVKHYCGYGYLFFVEVVIMDILKVMTSGFLMS
jgi:hypothetical protein